MRLDFACTTQLGSSSSLASLQQHRQSHVHVVDSSKPSCCHLSTSCVVSSNSPLVSERLPSSHSSSSVGSRHNNVLVHPRTLDATHGGSEQLEAPSDNRGSDVQINADANKFPSLFIPFNMHPMQTKSKNEIFKPKAFSTSLTEKEPLTIEEAFKSEAWTKAAQQEFNSLLQNQTCDLVPLPENRSVIRCK